MTPTTLHLMRHGVPEGAGRLLGHRDAAPTVQGIADCRKRATNLKISHAITSDLVRARAAALAIARDLEVPLQEDARWRELDFGQWDGCAPADIPQSELAAFWDDPERHPPPGGEIWSALVSRVEAALKDVSGEVLVIAHAGAMRAALTTLLGLDYRQSWAFDLPYAGLVSLRMWSGDPLRAQLVGMTT